MQVLINWTFLTTYYLLLLIYHFFSQLLIYLFICCLFWFIYLFMFFIPCKEISLAPYHHYYFTLKFHQPASSVYPRPLLLNFLTAPSLPGKRDMGMVNLPPP